MALYSVPRLLPLGDCAWTVEFGDGIDPALHGRVMGLDAALAEARAAGRLSGVAEWVPSFRSLTVHADPEADGDELGRRLLDLAATAGERRVIGRRWRLPVRFGGEAGPDLDHVAAVTGHPPEAIIGLISACVFRVYMIGFLPGFPYMGGLPEALACPRRATPRTVVPARSLAVAGTMCAVYPWESPGGWHLLGRTPARLFDPAAEVRPSLLAAGDEVMWQAIDDATLARLEDEAAHGQLDHERFRVAPEAPWPG